MMAGAAEMHIHVENASPKALAWPGLFFVGQRGIVSPRLFTLEDQNE
jgi:hypothetical protein